MLGPLVESAPGDMPPVYFCTLSCDDEVFPVVVGARSYAEANDLRDRVRLRLLVHPIRPCLHEFADELEMAKWAERTWPSAKVTALRRQIEAERRRN